MAREHGPGVLPRVTVRFALRAVHGHFFEAGFEAAPNEADTTVSTGAFLAYIAL